MTTSIDDLIALLTAARDQAQAEADAAIDRHGALDRALAALYGWVDAWVPTTVAPPIPTKVTRGKS